MGIIIETRDPQKSLEEKVKEYRRKILTNWILTIIAVLLAIISTYLLVVMHTYTEVRVSQTYECVADENSNYIQYSDGVLKYSRDGIAFLNKKGVEQWNQSYQMKTPILDIKKESVAVADRGGNDIFVFGKKGPRGEIHTNYPIEKIVVSENGIVSALLKNGSAPLIICYDSTGNILVEHRASLMGTGYPIGMAISPDGTMLQVSYLGISDGVQTTGVSYFNFGDGLKQENDIEKTYLVTEDIYKNTVIPVSFFIDGKTSILVGDEAFYIYQGEVEPEMVKKIELEKEIKNVFHDEEYIGFVLKDSGEDECELRLYNMEGKQKLSKRFAGEYRNVKIDRGNVIMCDGKKCTIFSEWGIQKFEGELEEAALEILPLSGINKYLLINAGKMEEVRLVK